LISGLENVSDKKTKADFDKKLQVPDRIAASAKKNGLILRVAGRRVAISPPLIINEAKLVDLAERMRLTMSMTA
jgi:4-aminobutyrate--pyruvate transaminase